MHVCDPEMIRLILVKDGHHFKERQKTDFGNPVTNEVLDWQHGTKIYKYIHTFITWIILHTSLQMYLCKLFTY